MSAFDVSRVGPEVYECEFAPPDQDHPTTATELDGLDFDNIELAPRTPAKPWDPLDEIGVPRDQWGRPQVLPDPAWGLAPSQWPDGVTRKRQMADGRRAYARVSTACGWNDIAHGLSIWRNRMSVLAIARRPDLQAQLCSMTYADGKQVDAIVDEALVRAADDGIDIDGELTAAARGTAWHAFTVPGTTAIDPTFGPTLAQYAVTSKAFDEALERCGLELLEHEQFAVDHSHELAGTVDHLAIVVKATPFSRAAGLSVGEVILLDKKTGKMQWISHITQIGMYARCRPTDWRTGETRPWHPEHNPDVGAIVSASLKTGKVKIYPVETPTYLVDLAVDRYRNSLSAHVNSLVGKGF